MEWKRRTVLAPAAHLSIIFLVPGLIASVSRVIHNGASGSGKNRRGRQSSLRKRSVPEWATHAERVPGRTAGPRKGYSDVQIGQLVAGDIVLLSAGDMIPPA